MGLASSHGVGASFMRRGSSLVVTSMSSDPACPVKSRIPVVGSNGSVSFLVVTEVIWLTSGSRSFIAIRAAGLREGRSTCTRTRCSARRDSIRYVTGPKHVGGLVHGDDLAVLQPFPWRGVGQKQSLGNSRVMIEGLAHQHETQVEQEGAVVRRGRAAIGRAVVLAGACAQRGEPSPVTKVFRAMPWGEFPVEGEHLPLGQVLRRDHPQVRGQVHVVDAGGVVARKPVRTVFSNRRGVVN
jgi:hypothetical protein